MTNNESQWEILMQYFRHWSVLAGILYINRNNVFFVGVISFPLFHFFGQHYDQLWINHIFCHVEFCPSLVQFDIYGMPKSTLQEKKKTPTHTFGGLPRKMDKGNEQLTRWGTGVTYIHIHCIPLFLWAETAFCIGFPFRYWSPLYLLIFSNDATSGAPILQAV